MNIRRPSALRDSIGFFVGGTLAAVAAGLAFLAFVPLGDTDDPRNHAPEALIMTILVLFVSGGFIGRTGFSADGLSDFFPSLVGTFAVVLTLPLLAGLSFGQLLPFIGFASVGVVASVAASLMLLKWFPLESE